MKYLFILIVYLSFFLAKAQTPPFIVTHLGTADGLSQGSIYSMLKDSRGVMWFGSLDGLNSYDGRNIKNYFPFPEKKNFISGSKISNLVEDREGIIWISHENGLSAYDNINEKFTNYFINEETSVISATKNKIWLWNAKKGFITFDYKTNTINNFYVNGKFDLNFTNTSNYSIIVSPDEYWLHLSTGIVHLKNGKETHYFSKDRNNINGKFIPITKLKLYDNKLYVGTKNGIEILDIKQNKISKIEKVDNIKLEMVYDFDIDLNSRLWICTEKNGLIAYDLNTKKIFRINKGTEYNKGLFSNYVSEILADSNGSIWVNTDPYGIDKIELLEGNFNHINLVYPDNTPDYLKDKSSRAFIEVGDYYWIGTLNGGIHKIRKEDFSLVQSFTTNNSGLNSNRIYCLFEMPNKNILIGTNFGLYVYDNKKIHELNLPKYEKAISGKFIRTIEYFDNLVYLSTEEGMIVLDPKLQKIVSNRFWADSRLTFTFHIASNKYLMGLISGGLFLVENNKKTNILKNEIPLFIKYFENKYLVGTNTGLFELNSEFKILKKYTVADGLPNNNVYCGEIDNKNNIWLSTNRGLCKLNIKTKEIISFNLNDGLQDFEFNGFASLKDHKGMMLFGGVNGINYFYPEQIKIPNNTKINVLDSDKGRVKLNQLEAFEDVKAEFERPELNNENFKKRFVSYTDKTPNFLFSKNNIWLHTIVNNKALDKWFLEVENTRLSELEIWVFEKGREVYYKKLGDKLDFSNYSIKDPNPIFELNLVQNQQYEIYFKANSSRDLKFPISFLNEQSLNEHLNFRKLAWGIFIGFTMLIFFYNIFLFLNIRELKYLYYPFYTLFYGMFQLNSFGFGYQYVWGNAAFNEYSFVFFLMLAFVFIVLFTGEFLELATHYLYWKPIKIFYISIPILVVLCMPFYYNYWFNYVSMIVGVLYIFIFFYTAIFFFRKKNKLFTIYGFATLPVVISGIIIILQNFGVIPSNNQEFIMMIGSMLEMVFFSLALGSNFKENLLEKNRQMALRNEISSNLHDDLAASLSSLAMYSELSKRKIDGDNFEISERLNTIANKSREILGKVRTAVYELNPSNDTEDDWIYRIINFGKEIFANNNIDFITEIDDNVYEKKIEIEVRREVFYFFKECMNNASKYSAAEKVVLKGRIVDNAMILSLIDNGKGFDILHEVRGNGIKNLAHRAQKIKAEYFLNSNLGTGTEIILKIN